jgi:DNA-binding response OmpR family regulator
MEKDREACFEAGMNAFIAKPASLDALAAILQRAAKRKTARQNPSPAPAVADSLTPLNVPSFELDDALERLGHSFPGGGSN